jgi:ribosome maturation factor RimP
LDDLNHNPPDEPGPDETGPDEPGHDNIGHDNIGHDDIGYDGAGADEIGPNEAGQLTLEAKLTAIVAPRLETMGFELVRVAVLGRERPTVQVMADRADGSLITVEDCEQISRYLSTVFDVEDPIPGAWNLEISSAGIDRPLTRPKDWNRFAGHLARVETMFPIGGRKRFSGIVLGADDKFGKLRLDDGTEAVVPLREIRRAKLALTDALIAFTAPSPTTN